MIFPPKFTDANGIEFILLLTSCHLPIATCPTQSGVSLCNLPPPLDSSESLPHQHVHSSTVSITHFKFDCDNNLSPGLPLNPKPRIRRWYWCFRLLLSYCNGLEKMNQKVPCCSGVPNNNKMNDQNRTMMITKIFKCMHKILYLLR